MAEDRLRAGQAAAHRDPPLAGGVAADSQAAIVLVSRDSAALAALERELSKRYGADYQVVACGQPAELDHRIRGLLAAGTPVSLVIGGVGAPDPDGIDVLAGVRAIDPTASRVAVVRWGDFDAARPLFDAVALGKIDHWVMRPVQIPRQCAGGTSSSSAAATPPGRPRCTWPSGPPG
jgi:response regulator RpfG family c-di-GMP phosphodiesterase